MQSLRGGDGMISDAIRLRNGKWWGVPGTFWAWPVDGYYDLHHADHGVRPDGSEVIGECFGTLAEVRKYVREVIELDKWGV